MKTIRMKSLLIIASAFSILLNLSSNAQVVSDASKNQSAIFLKGEKAPADNFTGTVWVKLLVPGDTTFNCVVGNVTFEPGARTNWHIHPSGQILLVTEGKGYYQEKGKPIQIIHKGDVIKCLPNVDHWHGASPDEMMTHIAINPNTKKGIVKWMQKVTDEEYKNLE